jgi:hypothetical protein
MHEMSDPGAADRLEQALGCRQVAAGIQLEIRPAPAEARHGGKVNHCFAAFDHRFEVGLPQIRTVQGELMGRPQSLHIPLFPQRRVVWNKGIDANHVMPVVDEGLAKVRSDEARGSGYQGASHAELCFP